MPEDQSHFSSAASAVALAEALHALLTGPLSPFTYGQIIDLLQTAVERDRAAELLATVDRIRNGEPGALAALEEASELEQILLRQLVVDQVRLEQAWAHHTGVEDDWAFSEVRFSRDQGEDSGAVEVRLLTRGGDDLHLRMPVWSLANLVAKLGASLEQALTMPGFVLDDEPKRERLLDTLESLAERLSDPDLHTSDESP